jgi:hypothetical protein
MLIAVLLALPASGYVCAWLAYSYALRRVGTQAGPARLAISPEGLTEAVGSQVWKAGWQEITRIEVTQRNAFFHCVPAAAHVLPRRAFATDQQFDDFVETARGHWEAARSAEGSKT